MADKDFLPDEEISDTAVVPVSIDLNEESKALIEQTIAETRPSVTSEELRQFEQTKDSFTKGHPQERPRIGFK
jgi:glutamate synthase domain-containing protein 3